MPVDAPTGMTFRQLMIALLERFGEHDEASTGSAAGLPSDAMTLDRAERHVKQGLRVFLSERPDWTFARRVHRLTMDPTGAGPDNVGGAADLYRIPRYLAPGPITDWMYRDDLATHHQAFATTTRALRDRAVLDPDYVNTPEWAAVEIIDTNDGPMAAVRFYPVPDRAYVVEADFLIRGQDLSLRNERHICGPEHDETILAAACLCYAKTAEPESVERWRGAYAEALARSVRYDDKIHPRRLGLMRGIDDTRHARALPEMQFKGTVIQ